MYVLLVSGCLGPCTSMNNKAGNISETEIGVAGTSQWKFCSLMPNTTPAIVLEISSQVGGCFIFTHSSYLSLQSSLPSPLSSLSLTFVLESFTHCHLHPLFNHLYSLSHHPTTTCFHSGRRQFRFHPILSHLHFLPPPYSIFLAMSTSVLYLLSVFL